MKTTTIPPPYPERPLLPDDELDRIRIQVDDIADPLAMYLLMWLHANPDPTWRNRRRANW